MELIYYVDITTGQFSDNYYFAKHTNLQTNIFHTNSIYFKTSTDVRISTFLEKTEGMRLWITKWTV